MSSLDTAIDSVSDRLQAIGAVTSRLSFKEEALGEAQVNTEAAFNRIMNADMAMSQLEATKYQILQQTATSMLAQANQAPQALLSLFR
jgi:flagellin